jgi:MoaA/NifB/PqqE/SkfB family radical SAM enzyme
MTTMLERLPSSICLRVTRRCNAACSFCQAPNTSRVELTVSQIATVATGLAAAKVRSLKLSGGEPTTRADLPAIVAAISASGLHPVVITNGIAVRAEVLDVMAAGDAEFKFSIHRPDSGNDAVLRVPSFDRILHNLAMCRRKKVRFSLNTVVTSETIDLMDAMAEFALDQGARKISFIPVVPRGRALRSGDRISQSQLDQVTRYVDHLSRQYADCLVVRCIDIRHHDYWIVENDGALWIERARECTDMRICGLEDLIALGRRTADDDSRKGSSL